MVVDTRRIMHNLFQGRNPSSDEVDTISYCLTLLRELEKFPLLEHLESVSLRIIEKRLPEILQRA